MLGDAYGAAVVEALSRKELEAMDAEIDNADDNKESVKPGPDEEALIGIYKSASNQSNGSSVKVREVRKNILKQNISLPLKFFLACLPPRSTLQSIAYEC